MLIGRNKRFPDSHLAFHAKAPRGSYKLSGSSPEFPAKVVLLDLTQTRQRHMGKYRGSVPHLPSKQEPKKLFPDSHLAPLAGALRGSYKPFRFDS